MSHEQERANNQERYPWQKLITPSILPILGFARQSAIVHGDACINGEHILQGILHDRNNEACQILTRIGIDVSQLESATNDMLGRRKTKPVTTGNIAYAPPINIILELAEHEAKMFGEKEVSPFFLLMGLILEERGIAAGILDTYIRPDNDAKISLSNLRSEARIFLEEQRVATREIISQAENPSFELPNKEDFLNTLHHVSGTIAEKKVH